MAREVDRELQLVFLINNYDLIVSILGVSLRELTFRGAWCLLRLTWLTISSTQESPSKFVEPEKQHFTQALTKIIADYREEVLLKAFGYLISFVKEAELSKDLSTIDACE
jgi:hypothetical protein